MSVLVCVSRVISSELFWLVALISMTLFTKMKVCWTQSQMSIWRSSERTYTCHRLITKMSTSICILYGEDADAAACNDATYLRLKPDTSTLTLKHLGWGCIVKAALMMLSPTPPWVTGLTRAALHIHRPETSPLRSTESLKPPTLRNANITLQTSVPISHFSEHSLIQPYPFFWYFFSNP